MTKETKETVKNDEDIFNMNAGAEGETSNDDSGSPTDSEVPAASSATFKIGDKEFASKEEADAHFRGLESDKKAAEAYSAGVKESMLQQMQPEVVEDTTATDMQALEDKFFQDPAGALTDVYTKAKDAALKELRKENNATSGQKQSWDLFYVNNPDLVGRSDLMDAMVAKYSQLPEYQKLSMSEGLNKVGLLLRQQLGVKKVVVSEGGPAITAGVGDANAGGVAAEVQKPVDFFSQLKQHQQRG